MLPVVVVRAVVVHDQEHRELQVGGGPQRTRIEEEIAIGLDVDDELSIAATRERHADRDPDMRRGAETATWPAGGRADAPELPRPVLEAVRCQNPVLAVESVPLLARE